MAMKRSSVDATASIAKSTRKGPDFSTINDDLPYDSSKADISADESVIESAGTASDENEADIVKKKAPYEPHPRKGSRGGSLGAPTKKEEDRLTQISVGCSKRDKEFFQAAAKADRRSLRDFVKCAIEEYVINHNLNVN